MYILSVETSCDETSVAILKNQRELKSLKVYSQIEIFKNYGGVIPEVASRNHVKKITKLIEDSLIEADLTPKDISLVAVTIGPGLIGSLLIGINAASAFAYINDISIVGVNHLVGHIYSANLVKEINFPALALIISGGHTDLVLINKHMNFTLLGKTLDDAAGEAYDKVAKILDLSYPGGPVIDELAKKGSDIYDFSRPFLKDHGFNFSFSGLKSSVYNLCNKLKGNYKKEDIACSFQNAVIDVIIYKIKMALKKYNVNQLLIVGGVASNSELRKRVTNEINNIEIVIPPKKFCTDNAAMIAAAAYFMETSPSNEQSYIFNTNPKLELSKNESKDY